LIDSSNTRLIIVPSGGLISANRVALAPRRLPSGPMLGLLVGARGEISQRTEVVRAIPVDGVPEEAIAVGADLAAKLDLREEQSLPWQLQLGGLRHQPLQELVLDTQDDEKQLDQIVGDLSRSSDLAGRLLWSPAANAREALYLEVAGMTYGIRDASPAPSPDTVLEVTPQTRVSVFAKSIKAGVDIVILADCSGSMSYDDLTDTADVPASGVFGLFSKRGSRSITRIEALRRALNRLLEIRLGVSGRISRIALVTFTEECNNSCIRFPRNGGGMVELDMNSPPALVQEFRDAIGLLRAEGGTQIGPALEFAAQLLSQSRPGNDRLVVLISDGASWKPKTDEEATGLEIGGLENEVQLMEQLHHNMKIHLHAIGISKPEIFHPWWRQQHPREDPHIGAIPNHDLLEQLVQVGGGDPSRIGDSDVLHEYFSGLGSGVSRQVKVAPAAAVPSVSAEEVEFLKAASARFRQAAPQGVAGERQRLAGEILDRHSAVNELAASLTKEQLFHPSAFAALYRSMSDESFDRETFQQFMGVLLEATFDRLHPWLESDGGRTYPIPSIVALVSSSEARELRFLRGACRRRDLDPQDTQRLGSLYQRMAGASTLEDRDSARWPVVQVAVLRIVHDLLTRMEQALRREETERAARAPQAPARPPAGRPSSFRLLE
jgi:Mg-chelatase subunit ChlD